MTLVLSVLVSAVAIVAWWAASFRFPVIGIACNASAIAVLAVKFDGWRHGFGRLLLVGVVGALGLAAALAGVIERGRAARRAGVIERRRVPPRARRSPRPRPLPRATAHYPAGRAASPQRSIARWDAANANGDGASTVTREGFLVGVDTLRPASVAAASGPRDPFTVTGRPAA